MKYMNRGVFRVMCFMLASHYKEEGYGDLLISLVDDYKGTYPADDFESDVRQAVPKLHKMMEPMSLVLRRKLFHEYYELARNIEPDGTRHKKLLGVFGGALFSESHPNPGIRVELLMAELAGYLARFPPVLTSDIEK
jgi:hypothetical protein